jgi:chromosome segregation ATPase
MKESLDKPPWWDDMIVHRKKMAQFKTDEIMRTLSSLERDKERLRKNPIEERIERQRWLEDEIKEVELEIGELQFRLNDLKKELSGMNL